MVGTRKIAAILVADIVVATAGSRERTKIALSRPRGLRRDLIDPAIGAQQSCDVSAATNRKTEDQREWSV